MLSGVKSFLVEKFWTPIVNESVYYNPFNTTVYALLFGIAALYVVYPVSKKMDVQFDRNFFIGVAPYIFLGGMARSLKDVDIVNTILLETPFIYFLMFFFTVGALFGSKKIAEYEGLEYHKIFSAIGFLTLLLILSFYTVSNFGALVYFIVIMTAWALPFYLTLKFLKPELLSYSFTLPIVAHYFDASTTVTSLAFGGVEKHVLAKFFITSFGPLGMFLMKTAVIVPVVYYINENMGGEEKNYYLFLIALLGIALGTRNLVSLLAI
jgi:uncharacterized membrane protein